MKTNNKLIQKWIEKTQRGEVINITDLYEFSNIKLKRSRMRKKFNKHYVKYVPKTIIETYWGICCSTPLVNSFKKYTDLDLNVESIGSTKITLTYPDFHYKG